MSRLLKEDADLLGEAYGKILLNEMVPPFEWVGDADPETLSVDPAKFKAVSREETDSKGQKLTKIEHLYLGYLEGLETYPSKLNVKDLAIFKNPANRAIIYSRLAKDLGKEIKKRIAAHGGVHPGLSKTPSERGTSSYAYSQLSNELGNWLVNWRFEYPRKDGTKASFPVVQQSDAGLSHAKWIADQIIKNVIIPAGMLVYKPGAGEKVRGSAGKIDVAAIRQQASREEEPDLNM